MTRSVARSSRWLRCTLLSAWGAASCGPAAPESGSESDDDGGTSTRGDLGVDASSDDENGTTSALEGESSTGAADGTTASETTSGGTFGTSGTSDDAVSSEETTAADELCPNSDHFECTVPPQCYDSGPETTQCGDVNSWYDADGCPRIDCTKGQPCPAGMRCHSPMQECGLCAQVNTSCGDTMLRGEIVCACSGDGSCAGAFCLDEVEFPPGFCGER
jgi:hypothetical protein